MRYNALYLTLGILNSVLFTVATERLPLVIAEATHLSVTTVLPLDDTPQLLLMVVQTHPYCRWTESPAAVWVRLDTQLLAIEIILDYLLDLQ